MNKVGLTQELSETLLTLCPLCPTLREAADASMWFVFP